MAFAALPILVSASAPAARSQPASAPPAQSEKVATERAELFAALAAAKSEPEAREIEEQIWKFWFRAPDAQSQRLLDLSKYAQLKFDYANAIARLDELIERAPDYAEGWNQRAIIFFLTGLYEQSLEAIKQTLKREPKHFGALAGKGIILLMLGRDAEGQAALKEALAINPWLKERGLISDNPGRKI